MRILAVGIFVFLVGCNLKGMDQAKAVFEAVFDSMKSFDPDDEYTPKPKLQGVARSIRDNACRNLQPLLELDLPDYIRVKIKNLTDDLKPNKTRMQSVLSLFPTWVNRLKNLIDELDLDAFESNAAAAASATTVFDKGSVSDDSKSRADSDFSEVVVACGPRRKGFTSKRTGVAPKLGSSLGGSRNPAELSGVTEQEQEALWQAYESMRSILDILYQNKENFLSQEDVCFVLESYLEVLKFFRKYPESIGDLPFNIDTFLPRVEALVQDVRQSVQIYLHLSPKEQETQKKAFIEWLNAHLGPIPQLFDDLKLVYVHLLNTETVAPKDDLRLVYVKIFPSEEVAPQHELDCCHFISGVVFLVWLKLMYDAVYRYTLVQAS
jgi:hypothetical protein